MDSDEFVFYGGEEFHIVATVPLRNMKRVESLVKKPQVKNDCGRQGDKR